jgi:O-antigen biosynthesis alpha-1,3-abequosyltransferase
MTATRVSICIPTYNFGQFIGDAVESVRKQYLPGTEIVILDGGSTDNTRDIVARHQVECPYIRYQLQPFKGGIDADMERCVALAQGEFCWLLSADDALVDGALRRIYGDIETACDVYLCNRLLCDQDLKPRHQQSWLAGNFGDFEVDLGDDRALSQYFDRASSIGALFSYMSTIIFRRESWNRISAHPVLAGTNYAHVHRLFAMRAFQGRMKYLAAPLVLCRGDNDSFLSLGLVGRHLIDLRGFHLIAQLLFPHDVRLRGRFKEVVNREHRWVTWVWLRSVTHDETEWEKIRHALQDYGYARPTIFAMECMARMPRVVTCARILRKLASRFFRPPAST